LICQYTLLDHEALLHIIGPDSLTFLQGQTTCDTREVQPGHAVPGAYCTPQGRVVCDFLLSQMAQDHYALRMRRDIRKSSAATFGKYIIFSKAELHAERDDWRVLACWGKDAAAALQQVFGESPTEQFGACAAQGYVLVQLDEAGQQFECYIHTDSDTQWLERMDTTMQLSSEDEWQALQILNGIGRIEAATVEEFIPQMLNYDLTGHVSFSKGCYTGQEVVARMHYRGKPKRRMYLAELPAQLPAAAGTTLFSSGNTQGVGNIVNSVTADGHTSALVVATLDAVASGLHLAAADGPPLITGEPPYALQSD
jgi:folate-binding protein YgfZ